jgi:ATP-binding cassette subfamily F protein 3
LIKVSGLAKAFGGQVLFTHLTWSLGGADRVGLIGANGTGKSTLLRIMAGLEMADDGVVDRPPDKSIGYLAQTDFTLVTGLDGTPEEEAWEAYPVIRDVDRRLAAVRERIGLESSPSLVEEEQDLIHRRQMLGGDEVAPRVGRTLKGLGFRTGDFSRPLRELSSGWQMRAALARILLQDPAVLLLDEPTNHLDIESRTWLAEYLAGFGGCLVIVSHDRTFLDRTVHGITEILGGKLESYTGGYTAYEGQKAARHALRLKAYERQQKEIERIKIWINKYRAQKRLASRVQSRIRMLERMERLPPPQAPPAAIRVRFPEPAAAPRVLCRMTGVRKTFGDVDLFDQLDVEIHRGERLAIVGPNGAGKSTLLRILGGSEPFQSGERWIAPEVTFGTFSHDEIQSWNPRRTVLEAAQDAGPGEGIPRLRGLLGAFLFRGDDVEKPVAALSGGERSRLALALLLLAAPNLLVLDEPTNHLDIQSIQALIQALDAYPGTLLLVAHDHYVLSRVATRVLFPSGKGFRPYPGTYGDYLWAREHRPEDFDPSVTPRPPERAAAEAPTPEATTPGKTPAPAPRRKSAQRLQREMKDLEDRIRTLEERRRRFEAALASPEFFKDPMRSQPYLVEHGETVEKLEALYESWVSLQQEVDGS